MDNLETIKQYDTETLLQAIITDMQHEYQHGNQQIAMSDICKRLSVRMNVLHRHFTLLDSLGFAYTLCDDHGHWTAYLTVQGLDLSVDSDGESKPDTPLTAPRLAGS